MIDDLIIEHVPVASLLGRVRALREDDYRLVQISAARLSDQLELTYSFDLNGRLHNLRLCLPAADPRVPSLSSIYASVVLYENELHDLFGVHVEGMALDLKGNLYKTAIPFPFAAVKPPPAKPADGTARPIASQTVASHAGK
jgi:ech hydrogenase subunit D